ncbi:MAG: 23S rRNA (guanosine(2251)-2'-O)-methyltransferase RlmB [Longimonas sp.]|uniref:23S rRNA (guanosine(2251)-2'-O)-methyltransferase RlmB n=1 Tax=Longimonas sp. TaxID=2039626 RepID=UPI0033457B92
MPADSNARTCIIGRQPVIEMLERDPSAVDKVMMRHGLSGPEADTVRTLAEEASVPVQYVPYNRLDHEADGGAHQGMLAWAAPVSYLTVNTLMQQIAPTWDAVQSQKPLLLVVDHVTDPRNFGAMLRCAVAAGVDGVIVPNSGMAPLTTPAIKASAGTALRIPIARCSDLAETLVSLKERSYWIVGAQQAGADSMWDTDWDRPIALVMGSEGTGLTSGVANACDLFARIPMRGAADSLNVSVATGILLTEATKPRVQAAA